MAYKNSKKTLKISWATLVIVVLNIYVFSREKKAIGWGIINTLIDDFSFNWGLFGVDSFSQVPNLISYTFLHGSEIHLIGNLIFFLLFAPAVERTLGGPVFLVVYSLWGISAALTQGFFEPFMGGLIGASGAISGTAGAFFVLFPLKLPPKYIASWVGPFLSRIPAFFFIGLWFVSQIHHGFLSLVEAPLAPHITMVAYWAHVGGFVMGGITALPWVLMQAPSK